MDLSILNNLKAKATLLVPSRRLTSNIRQQVQACYATDSIVWETPSIYALEDWFLALWDQFEIEGVVNDLLLSPMQTLMTFEQIIAQSDSGKTLLRQAPAAKTALQAWHHLHHWLCEDILLQPPENVDQAAFMEWALAYQGWLSAHHCIDNTLLTSSLLSVLAQDHEDIVKRVSPQKDIMLYGFEELSPLTTHFFASLQSMGWQVTQHQATSLIPESLSRIEFNQKEQEYAAAARWAKKIVTEKNQSVTIVVPNLADERSALEGVFRDLFEPEHVLDPALTVSPYFNISAATPLIQYPLIFEAMGFLKLAFCNVECLALNASISSAFAQGATEEQFARAQMMNAVKNKVETKLSLTQLLVFIQAQQEISVPQLEAMLSAVLKKAQRQPSNQSLSEWMQVFKEILSLIGWPGERPLTSVEYQLVKRMDELCNEMMLCDGILAPQSAINAINLLQKVAANIPFQAENKGAAIQLLGLLEAAGQTFDNLWIMGMDSEAWPPVATPNPFIPIELQRTRKMPHASCAREMEYAQKVTTRFKESANSIIFSCTLKDKEKNLTVSELIENIPLSTDTFPTELSRCENHFVNHHTLESIEDNRAPALHAQEVFKGTATTLRLQSLCPFKAFAEQRLDLRQQEIKSIWLQPQQQGNIVHNVLEEFWIEVKDQTTLNQHSENDIRNMLQALIAKHLSKTMSSQAPMTYVQAEKNRLLAIFLDYIQLEKQRAPFKVVFLEQKKTFSLAQINFSLRIDRIDKDSSGNHIIIDYKTGKFGLNEIWEALASPQLPLYFCANAHLKPKAVIVIKLNAKVCEFEGVSEACCGIPHVKALESLDSDRPADWQSLYAYWHERLLLLANAFQSGDAYVKPHKGTQACRYCHLGAVCRIKEVEANDE